MEFPEEFIKAGLIMRLFPVILHLSFSLPFLSFFHKHVSLPRRYVLGKGIYYCLEFFQMPF